MPVVGVVEIGFNRTGALLLLDSKRVVITATALVLARRGVMGCLHLYCWQAIRIAVVLLVVSVKDLAGSAFC
jgi:hypothetical protein